MTVIRDPRDPHGAPIPERRLNLVASKSTPAERVLATQYVARSAQDEQDCALLLDMLGLDVP